MPQPPVRDLRVSVYLCACPSASLFLAQISLGCCQSMPKPPSAKKPSAGERLPDSLSLCLSVSLSLCLAVSLSRCLSVSVCESPVGDPWFQPLTATIARVAQGARRTCGRSTTGWPRRMALRLRARPQSAYSSTPLVYHSLSLCVSVCLYVSPCVCVCLRVPLCVSLCLSVCLCLMRRSCTEQVPACKGRQREWSVQQRARCHSAARPAATDQPAEPPGSHHTAERGEDVPGPALELRALGGAGLPTDLLRGHGRAEGPKHEREQGPSLACLSPTWIHGTAS